MKKRGVKFAILMAMIWCGIGIIGTSCAALAQHFLHSAEQTSEQLVWVMRGDDTSWNRMSSCYAGHCLVSLDDSAGQKFGNVIGLDGKIDAVIPITAEMSGLSSAGNGVISYNYIDRSNEYYYMGTVPVNVQQSTVYDTHLGDEESFWTVSVSQGRNYRILSRQDVLASQNTYKLMTPYYRNWAVAVTYNGKKIILNGPTEVGDCALQTEFYDWDEPQISEGYLRFAEKGKTSFLLVSENQILDRDGVGYEDARDFHDGLAAVKVNGKWGYIDTEEEFIIKPQYQQAYDFCGGVACVMDEDGTWFFVNRANQQCSDSLKIDNDHLEWVGMYHDGVFVVCSGKYDYVLRSTEQRRHIPKGTMAHIEYCDGIWYCMESFERDSEGNAYFPDVDACVVSIGEPGVYDTSVLINEGKKTSLFDKKSANRLCTYKEIMEYENGLACVSSTISTGYIDARGEVVLGMMPKAFGTFFFQFSNGVAPVNLKEYGSGYIAHPLLYDHWTPDELERAADWGLTVTDSEESLTYPVLWERMTELAERKYDAVELLGIEDPTPYEIDVRTVRSQLEKSGFPTDGTVDRQHLAKAMAALARASGMMADGYLPLYEDKEQIAPDCFYDMGYACAIGLFDLDTEGKVIPDAAVSLTDLSIYCLRYMENTL